MKYETAGDSITGLLWTKKTRQKIADELSKAGIVVSATTVGKILKDLKYSLKCNSKKVANGGRKLTKEQKKAADDQFAHIAKMRKHFAERGLPILSCDTKKKELIGDFKNPGTRYRQQADLVNDHDFASYAVGRAFPYGIYDEVRNEGFVYVGQALWDHKDKRFTSHDTPEFAAESVARWWKDYGSRRYPGSKELLLLVDAGGSNGYRPRMWKFKLFSNVSTELGLTVTVCHYPPGKSKWNPVEHRLFGEISKCWAGTPLRTFETVLKYIRRTATKTGLAVMARLVTKTYRTGQVPTKKDFARVEIKHHDVLPAWNYTIAPAL
ncbi:hypothetical protein LCGC14_1962190 [marine sediment metagenome]|uniref:ISAzo13 family transposase n=1 Tax=marine sediment metagenome TaxID=412755 RepID=A0A0F9FEJ2_9ZZZZ